MESVKFQTGIGDAAYATLGMAQLISCLGVAFVDTIFSLSDPEQGVFPVLEVHEFLINVHDILDSAVSKQVGNSAHILTGSVVTSGLHNSPLFTFLRMWFLLVRLASMAI